MHPSLAGATIIDAHSDSETDARRHRAEAALLEAASHALRPGGRLCVAHLSARESRSNWRVGFYNSLYRLCPRCLGQRPLDLSAAAPEGWAAALPRRLGAAPLLLLLLLVLRRPLQRRIGLLLLRNEGVSCSFPKRRHLSRTPLFLAQPRQKKDSGAAHALSPLSCFRWFSTLYRSLLSYRHKKKTKQRHTPSS